MGVELKDVASKVNLGTLGKSLIRGDYGGSITRIARSAERFFNSSKDQLRLMSQTVRNAYDAGMLENALFTSGAEASEGALGVFDEAYQLTQDGVNTLKEASKAAPDELKNPGFWAQVGMGARAFIKNLSNALISPSSPLPFMLNPQYFMNPDYFNHLGEPVDV